jgi:hypothetical protein
MRRTANAGGLIAASALAAAALGCGGGDDTSPRETTEAFFQAVADGDGAEACGYLTDELVLSGLRSRDACAKALTFAPDDPDRDQFAGASANIVDVKEADDGATVRLTDFEFDRIVLTREDDEWKIARLVD